MERITKYLICILTCMTLGISGVISVFADEAIEGSEYSVPEGLVQIDADINMVEVEWTESEGASYYEVQCFEDRNELTDEADIVESYDNYVSIYNLDAGQFYYIRVRAVYVEDEQQYSDWSDLTEVVTTVEQTAQIRQTKAEKDSITIKWDRIESASSYNIYKKTKNRTVLFGNTDKTSIKVTKMTADTSIVVAAVKTSETGFFTENISVLKASKIRLKPGKVKNISVEDNGRSFKISYEKNNGIYGFEVKVYNMGKKLLYKKSTALAYVKFKKPKTNCFYKVKIRAYTKLNGKKMWGAWSSYFYFGDHVETDIERGRPSGVQLSWIPCEGVKKYSVYISTDNVNFEKIADTTKTHYLADKYKGKKIKNSKKYYFYVIGVIKKGKNTYSTCVRKSVFLDEK